MKILDYSARRAIGVRLKFFDQAAFPNLAKILCFLPSSPRFHDERRHFFDFRSLLWRHGILL